MLSTTSLVAHSDVGSVQEHHGTPHQYTLSMNEASEAEFSIFLRMFRQGNGRGSGEVPNLHLRIQVSFKIFECHIV